MKFGRMKGIHIHAANADPERPSPPRSAAGRRRTRLQLRASQVETYTKAILEKSSSISALGCKLTIFVPCLSAETCRALGITQVRITYV